jgi:4-hydroxythreonine-4-phosphate dehydrogenase
MIHITQGHEKGIGAEVFIKSLLFLSQKEVNQIIFHCDKSSLENTLKLMPINYHFNNDQLTINSKVLKIKPVNIKSNPTLCSLKSALKEVSSKDILFTLPSSKDQLSENDTHFLGYTEYLRNYFKNPYISMCFYSDQQFISLLTDHININNITSTLSHDYIVKKAKSTLDNFTKLNLNIENVFFSGINPHSGEGGLIGNEDEEINKAIKSLTSSYSHINFNQNALPADTIHFNSKSNTKELTFYSSHDQGLALYKKQNGLLAVNVTLGLPFIRMSVDHGTAFDIAYQNKAEVTSYLEAVKIASNYKFEIKKDDE